MRCHLPRFAFRTTVFVHSPARRPTLLAESGRLPLPRLRRSLRLCLRDLGQIRRHDPPPDPAPHALIPMLQAPIQSIVPFEHPDAPFDPRTKPKAPPEPALLFVCLALLGDPPWLRQHNLLDLQLVRELFILWRKDAAIAGQQVRGTAEALLVRLQARRQLGMIQAPTLLEQAILTDDPAFHLPQPQLPPEFGRLARLVPPDDLGLGLEQTQQLLPSGHLLAQQHAPPRLLQRLINQGQEPVQLLAHPPSLLAALLLQ